MKFLNRLLSALEGYIRSKTKTKSLYKMEPSEPIARFIVQKGDFIVTQNVARPRAFLPNTSLETSVFRIFKLTSSEIWNIGETYVSGPRNRTLYGRADLINKDVEILGLSVIPDNVPDRHANIVGWPKEKDKQISLAQELAAVATLKLK